MLSLLRQNFRLGAVLLVLLGPGFLWLVLPSLAVADSGKTKVVYHVNGDDQDLAKYALALINKHIEAEGGPEKIDIILVVHGPALKLFEARTVDSDLENSLKVILDKGVQAEIC